MKKFLSIIAALLISVSGAWAAVSPATGAYPVEGKTYYLYSQGYDKADRYYLYYNETETTVKRAASVNTKEETDAYKWTVTKSGDNFIITNVASNTSLKWDNTKGLILSSNGEAMVLSKNVIDAACVSLFSNVADRWLCISTTSEAFAHNLKMNSASTNATYPTDFVFEEVLSDHSLKDGALYTICCDNDNPQYLYDGGDALLVSNEASSSLNYVFKCIVNGDYYNFRNVKTGKYLAFKGRSASAVNFTVSTDAAKHDGCATIQSGSTYWVMNANNNFDQSSITYYKGYKAYSTDFRFEKVTLDNYYEVSTSTGTLGTGDWTNTWTHNSTPAFTFTANVKNISSSLQLAAGSAGSSTYTLTAPVGYVISEYSLAGTGNNQTVTVAGGTATKFTSSINYVEATPRSNKATFVIAGTNSNHISPVSFMVKVEPMTSITDVASTDASKSYNIYNNRGVWAVANGADVVNSTAELSLAYLSTDAKQKFAFIPYNEKYYLYSVSAGKFAYVDGTKLSLTECFTPEVAASPVTFATSTSATYAASSPVVVQVNGESFGVSTNYSPDIIKHSPHLDDDGNAAAIYEAGDFDNTSALAQIANTTNVTYHLIYNSTEKGNVTVYALVGADLSLPSSLDTYCMTYKYYSDAECTSEITTVPAGGGHVYVEATWAGPVKFTTTTSAPEYYNLNIRSQYLVYDDEATGDVKLQATSEPFNPDASWAFIGDPYTGFKIINKTNGADKYLTYTSVVTGGNGSNNNIQFVADDAFTDQYWYIDTNTGGFCLRMKENNNIYFHHDNSSKFLRTCSLSEWSAVHNDAGSTIVAATDEQALFDLYEAMKDWTFGTSIGQMNTTDEETINNATAMTTLIGVGSVISSSTIAAYPAAYAGLMQIQNNMALVTPPAGYYRLKNVATGKYLTATTLSNYSSTNRYVYANGDATSAATVIRLVEGDDGMYMYNQGYGFGWVDSQKAYGGGIGYITKTADKYLHWFAGKAAGQIAFAICLGNGVDGYSSYLTRGIYTVDTEDNAVIGGTDYTADAAQWIFEPATSVEVALNTIGDETYATLCVPFDFTLDGATAYTLSVNSENNAQLDMKSVNGTVAAGTPVVLKGTNASATLTIGSNYANAPLTTTDLTGIFLKADVPAANNYFLGRNNGEPGFYKWGGGETLDLAANRAYLTISTGSSSNGFKLNFEDDDDVTGIESALNGQSLMVNGQSYYDLTGRKVANPVKGQIYIVNGKKVLF